MPSMTASSSAWPRTGYTAEEAKLDAQCRSGVQSFWMPCTNKLHQDQALFVLRGTRTREILKYGITPNNYVRTQASVPLPDLPTSDQRSTDRREVDRMIAELQSMTEGRHTLFFQDHSWIPQDGNVIGRGQRGIEVGCKR